MNATSDSHIVHLTDLSRNVSSITIETYLQFLNGGDWLGSVRFSSTILQFQSVFFFSTRHIVDVKTSKEIRQKCFIKFLKLCL